MKFRLNKHDDEITLEFFLKAVKADEDYQKIRFMIKDGKVWINGDKEYARRRLLRVGDNIAFEDKFYTIFPHRDERVKPVRNKQNETSRSVSKPEMKAEKVIHNKAPLKWTEKKIRKKSGEDK